MIVKFSDLRKYDFEISDVNVIRQSPKYRSLDVINRYSNGFLVIIHGYCRYIFEGGEFGLEPNSVVYLPKGSRHVLEIDSDEFEFFRIDFSLKIGGELALFSDLPQKICNSISKEAARRFRLLWTYVNSQEIP